MKNTLFLLLICALLLAPAGCRANAGTTPPETSQTTAPALELETEPDKTSAVTEFSTTLPYLNEVVPDCYSVIEQLCSSENSVDFKISSGDGTQIYAITTENTYDIESFSSPFNYFNWEPLSGDINLEAEKNSSESFIEITSADGKDGLTFFNGSGYVYCRSGIKSRWYNTTAVYENDPALFEQILYMLDSLAIKSAFDSVKIYSNSTDYEKIAGLFMEKYMENLLNLPAGSLAEITDYRINGCDVYLTDENDKTKFAFACGFAVRPADLENTYWWAGNTVRGDSPENTSITDIPKNELINWLFMGREIRLDYNAQSGFWYCTNIGTGGITLD